MKLNVFKLIEELGRKSKPLLNYFLEHSDINDDELIRYIQGLNYFYMSEYDKTIEIFSEGFESQKYNIRASQTLITIFFVQQNKEAFMQHYNNLKESMPYLSRDLEYDTRMSLAAFEMMYLGDYKRIEKLKILNIPYRDGFNYYYKARLNFNYKNDFEAGMKYIELAYDTIKGLKRPSLEIMIFNSYVYNSYKYKKSDKFYALAEELAFFVGYWFDIFEYENWIPVFDTIIEIKKEPRYYEIFANLIEKSNERRPDFIDKSKKIKEKKEIELITMFDFFEKESSEIKENIINIPVEFYISHISKYSDPDKVDIEIKGRMLNNKIFNTKYEEGRLKRVEEFFSLIGDDKKERFSEFYYSCPEIEKEYLDCFVINYPIYMEYSEYINDLCKKKKFYYSFFKKTNFNYLVATVVCDIWNPEIKSKAMDTIEKMIDFVYR